MSLKEELLNAAKPFLMKEGLESSKEIIATNSTSFDEMGMANSKPGEFSQEEITDPENLINVSKMANDNDFNAEAEESETVVSILGIDPIDSKELGDLINLGTGKACKCEDPEHCDCPRLADVFESVLRKKDKAFLESLTEESSDERMTAFINRLDKFLASPDEGASTIEKIDKYQSIGLLFQDLLKDLGGLQQLLNLAKEGNVYAKEILTKVGLEDAMNESALEEMAFSYAPGVIPPSPGKGKAARDAVTWVGRNLAGIKAGTVELPDSIKSNWNEIMDIYKGYSNSNVGSPAYKKVIDRVIYNAAVKSMQAQGIQPNQPEYAAKFAEEQTRLANEPTEEMCATAADELNSLLQNPVDLKFTPGESFLSLYSTNRAQRDLFQKAFNAEQAEKGTGGYKHTKAFGDWLSGGSEEKQAEPELTPEDLKLLKQHKIPVDSPDARKVLELLKKMQANTPAAQPAKKGKLAKALESVLAESDYAGNLSYNPDKRLNASDVLNAVKNAVKPELAAGLSIVKNIDANEEPIYSLQNIDEKDLPEKLEIDTNTDKKVVLKKDGNSYKFDK